MPNQCEHECQQLFPEFQSFFNLVKIGKTDIVFKYLRQKEERQKESGESKSHTATPPRPSQLSALPPSLACQPLLPCKCFIHINWKQWGQQSCAWSYMCMCVVALVCAMQSPHHRDKHKWRTGKGFPFKVPQATISKLDSAQKGLFRSCHLSWLDRPAV